MTPEQLKAIAAKASETAAQASAFIRAQARQFDQQNVEYKGSNDLVSYVDREAERIIVDALEGVVPEAGFMAEEGTGQNTSQGLTWIIDPLDGTTNFVHGIPVFAVSIGLVNEAGAPLIGVVYDVMRQQCFCAVRGNGATLDGQPIRVSTREGLSQCVMAIGTPYHHDGDHDPTLGMMAPLITGTRALRRLGAAALDMAYVACGRFDGFFEYNLKPWDVAAGTLLIREAGGVVSAFASDKNPIFDGEMIAGSQAAHGYLQHMVDEVLATMSKA